MTDIYVGSVQHAAVAQFAVLTPYTVGMIVRQLAAPAAGNERCFRCTTAGTSGGSEPSWNLGAGATTASGGATFTEVTGNATYNWAAPCARLLLATQRANNIADRIFVRSTHDAATAANVGIGTNGSMGLPQRIYCVTNASGNIPPADTDYVTTPSGKESSSGVNNINPTNYAEVHGLWLNSNLQLLFNGSSSYKFVHCKLSGNNTGAIVVASNRVRIELEDCGVDFTAVGQSIQLAGGHFSWKNSPTPLPGTIPTILFDLTSAIRGQYVEIDGVDFSAAGSGKIIFSNPATGATKVICKNCKFHASATVISGTFSEQSDFNFFNCQGTALIRQNIQGVKSKELTIIRTGGASDGVAGMSWKIVTTSSCNAYSQFETHEVEIWNATVGSPVTTTFAIENDGTTFTNQEVVLEAYYLGTSSSDLASFVSSAPATPITATANLSSSTETWTTTGQASPIKQQVSVTFTAQKEGYVRYRFKIGRASKTLYVCPKKV
jgi:hypothetical protein